jgi:hypothetical protein
MGESCYIVPAVTNKTTGEIGKSRLYMDLYSSIGNDREKTIDMYQRFVGENKEIKDSDGVTFDQFGEPTIESLYNITNLREYVNMDKFLSVIETKYGISKNGIREPIEFSQEKMQHLYDIAYNFNNHSELRNEFSMVVERHNVKNKQYIYAYIKPFDSNAVGDMNRLKKLNKALEETLNSIGISITCLKAIDYAPDGVIEGKSDFRKLNDAADGLSDVIGVANNIMGQIKIPEETAHVIIEMMKGKSVRDRLVSLIRTKNLAEKIIGDEYQKYVGYYDGDEDLLAEEAAGQLVANSLMGSDIDKVAKPMTNRVVNQLLDMLRGCDDTELKNTIKELGELSNTIADLILTGKVKSQIDRLVVDKTKVLYGVRDKADVTIHRKTEEDKSILNQIRDIEIRMSKIRKDKNTEKGKEETKKYTELIKQLQQYRENNQTNLGIHNYLKEEATSVAGLLKRLSALKDNKKMSLQQKAEILVDVRNRYFAYKASNELIYNNIDDMTDITEDEKAEIKDQLSALQNYELYAIYNRIAMSLFCEFADGYLPDKIKELYKKHYGKDLDVKTIFEMSESDISIFDMWLDSAGESSDIRINLFDSMNKQHKQMARMRSMELSHKILAIGAKYREKGITDYDFFFEYKNGHKTGEYISKYDMTTYYEERREYIRNRIHEFGVNSMKSYDPRLKKIFEDWNKTHTVDGTKDGDPIDAYLSKEYKALSSGQREMFNEMMEIKQEFDDMLPDHYTHLSNAIKINKDIIEIARKDGVDVKQYLRNIQSEYFTRCGDSDIGAETKCSLKDFENRAVQNLPIYYTKMFSGDNADSLSTDIISTMIAYGTMATTYDEMSGVINQMEIGRALLNNSQTKATMSGKVLKNISHYFTSGVDENGNSITTDEETESDVTIPFVATNAYKRLNALFDMQIYGKYQKEESFKLGKYEVNGRKVGNKLAALTAVGALGCNFLNDVSNVITGLSAMQIEVMGKKFLKPGDLAAADRTYFSQLGDVAADWLNPIKSSKLALFDEMFNVFQDWGTVYQDIKFEENSMLSKMMNKSIVFMGSKAGEHWLQNRTALAMAYEIKLKSPSGEEVPLWDALEVVPIDKSNPQRGYNLQVKKGYTNLDGSEYSKQDVIDFARRCGHINQGMHGIYNKEDMSMIQQYTVGRLMMEFRKWIKPQLNKKFASGHINFDSQEWEEGYYITFIRFLKKAKAEEGGLIYALTSTYKNLDADEKANVNKALMDMGLCVAAALAFWLITKLSSGFPPDKKPWALKLMEYFLVRFKTDQLALQPSPTMISEGGKILKSPSASLQVVQDMYNFINVLNPANSETFNGDDALVKNGVYKGLSKDEKYFLKMPLMLSVMGRGYVRAKNSDTLTKYYKQ